MEPKWISVYGKVDISDTTLTHTPLLANAEQTFALGADGPALSPPHALLKANLEFEQGTINWESKLSAAEDKVHIMISARAAQSAANAESTLIDWHMPELAVGLNVLGAPYGAAIWNGQTWTGLGGTGQGASLPLNTWIPMKLVARGSTLELSVHGIKVFSITQALRRGQIGALLQGSGAAAIRNVEIETDMPICFVVMQFTPEFNTLYTDVIRPVCEANGYTVVRADDFHTSGQIIEDVTQSIRTASLIIADVTPDNPNVFYELGFAHAIGKPTVLLSDRKRERLPFDISGLRTIFYDNTIGGKKLVETRLQQHMDALRQS